MLPFESAPVTWTRDGYALTTDRAALDLPACLAFLTTDAYWAATLQSAQFERAVAGSLPFTLRDPSGHFAGFARVVTDGAVFAYLRDVFVLPAHRGGGLGLWMSGCVCAHPDLATVTNWMLSTADAHGLYGRLGFAPHPRPETVMQRRPAAAKPAQPEL